MILIKKNFAFPMKIFLCDKTHFLGLFYSKQTILWYFHEKNANLHNAAKLRKV